VLKETAIVSSAGENLRQRDNSFPGELAPASAPSAAISTSFASVIPPDFFKGHFGQAVTSYALLGG
jgi:hypothetical protein